VHKIDRGWAGATWKKNRRDDKLSRRNRPHGTKSDFILDSKDLTSIHHPAYKTEGGLGDLPHRKDGRTDTMDERLDRRGESGAARRSLENGAIFWLYGSVRECKQVIKRAAIKAKLRERRLTGAARRKRGIEVKPDSARRARRAIA